MKKKTLEFALSFIFLLFCFFYFAAIPKMLFFPLAPKYFFALIVILLLSYRLRFNDVLSLKNNTGPFIIYLVMVLVFAVIRSSVNGMVPPIEEIALLGMIYWFVNRQPERVILMTRFIGILAVLSSLWFIGNLLFPDHFIYLRAIIYGRNIDPNNPLTSIALARPTGLTFNHHIMGYQMTAGIVIAGLLAMTEKNTRWKWFWRLSLLVVWTATYFTAQRSVVLAVIVTILIFSLQKFSRMIPILLVYVLATASAYYINNIVPEGTETLLTRLDGKDIKARVGWQVTALEVIAENPLGLSISEKTWEEEAVQGGADFSLFGDEATAVHNSFLGAMLNYGWLGIALVMSIALYLIKNIRQVLRYNIENVPYIECCKILAYVMVALTVQAMFHNASYLTNETVSCLVLGTFLVGASMMRHGTMIDAKYL